MSAVLLFGCFCLLLVVRRMWNNHNVSRIFVISLAFHCLMWYLVPVVGNVAMWDRGDFYSFVSRPEFNIYASIEIVAIGVTALFMLYRRPYVMAVARLPGFREDLSERSREVILLTCFAITVLKIVLDPLRGASYLERNSVDMVAQYSSSSPFYAVIALISTFATGYIYAFMVDIEDRGSRTRYLKLIGWTLITFEMITLTLQGSRIALLVPLILFAFILLRRRRLRLRHYVVGVLSVVAFLTTTSAIVRTIGTLRGMQSLTISEVVEGRGQQAGASNSIVLETIYKFNNIQYGAALLRMQPPGFAGTQPYIGAFLALVPRFIVPSKPHPGSYNQDITGTPARVAALSLGSYDEDTGNVGVSPGVISMWQLGYWGLLFLVVANVLNFYICNTLLLSRSLLYRALGFYMINIPSLTFLFCSPDVFIMTIQRVVAVMLIIYVSHFILYPRKRRAKGGFYNAPRLQQAGPQVRPS